MVELKVLFFKKEEIRPKNYFKAKIIILKREKCFIQIIFLTLVHCGNMSKYQKKASIKIISPRMYASKYCKRKLLASFHSVTKNLFITEK